MIWSRNKIVLGDLNNQHYNISNQQDIHMFVSKLSILRSNYEEDNGIYELAIKNPFGEKVCTVQVNIKRRTI
jgi:hypothetical protein